MVFWRRRRLSLRAPADPRTIDAGSGGAIRRCRTGRQFGAGRRLPAWDLHLRWFSEQRIYRLPRCARYEDDRLSLERTAGLLWRQPTALGAGSNWLRRQPADCSGPGLVLLFPVTRAGF